MINSLTVSQISGITPKQRCQWHRKLLFLVSGLTSIAVNLSAQNESRFYASTYSNAVFAQIDGDQASGYNKLGYAIGAITGFTLSDSKFQAIEFHLGIAERGSRRPPNIDDPSINPFHIRYQTFEAALGVVLPITALPIPNPISLFAGFRPYRLFKVEDTEVYMPSIDQDMRRYGALVELQIRYPIREKWQLSVISDYSITSISKGSANSNIYYPMGNGAYHNNISLGLIYKPNNRK